MFQEGQHPGEFIVTESSGDHSRQTVTLASRPEPWVDGTVLGPDGGSGLVAWSGSGPIAGILIGAVSTAAAAAKAVAIARVAEVNLALLTYPMGSVIALGVELSRLKIRTLPRLNGVDDDDGGEEPTEAATEAPTE